MADYAPGTEQYDSQQTQPGPDMTQQNSTQVPQHQVESVGGGYQQRQVRGNRAGDKIFGSKDEDDDTKLFVGGLNWQTDKDTLKKYFESYGDIVDAIVKLDEFGKSRCFAFVKFADANAANKVLSAAHHIIDGKQVDCKMARPQPKPDFLKVKKLFVGGLSNATTEEVLKKYFGQLGKITSFDQPVDPDTKKKRGFCFITFDSEDSVNEAMKSQYHYIGEEQARVEVKRAQNKGDKDQSGGYGYQAQQRAGQTGYWGEWGQGYNQTGYDQNAYQQYQYGQGYYGQYPTNQYPNYYGQPYYDQSAYYNYNQAAGYQYGQTGTYDYTQAYSQGYTGGNENSEYGKAQNDTSTTSGSSYQYHPYSR